MNETGNETGPETFDINERMDVLVKNANVVRLEQKAKDLEHEVFLLRSQAMKNREKVDEVSDELKIDAPQDHSIRITTPGFTFRYEMFINDGDFEGWCEMGDAPQDNKNRATAPYYDVMAVAMNKRGQVHGYVRPHIRLDMNEALDHWEDLEFTEVPIA